MRLQRYKVFADAFNAGGKTWKDGAIAGSGGVARPVIVSRIIGSDPKQTAGVEYDCLPGLGLIPALDTGGDAFYFPNQDDPEKTEAQLRMASMMISKSVQVDFNLKKGSLPVRTDVDLESANACMTKGLEILKDPANIVPGGDQLFSSDTQGQMEDLLAEFWTNPDLTPAEAHDAWATIIEEAD